jgi:hypothetical protein
MASAQDIKPPLTLEGLATLFRQDVDDLPGDTVTDVNWKNTDTGLLWSNQEICRYANQAVSEFCFRQPIHDHGTDLTITHVAVSATTQIGNLSNKILAIKRAKWVDGTTDDEGTLLKRTSFWMDRNHPGWDEESAASKQGFPEFYIDDMDNHRLYLWPIPVNDGSIHLTVDRLPSEAMLWPQRHQHTPEIHEQHHLCLLDYMKHLAYKKRDTETEDKQLAKDFLASFDAMVGPRPSARLLRYRKQERSYPRRVKAQFF